MSEDTELLKKYGSLIDLANNLGVQDLRIKEADGVLYIDGAVQYESDKKKLWEEYARIDPEYRTGDLVLNIDSRGEERTTYTVRPGDTLSGIGSKYGVAWKEIFEANRDVIENPDVIQPGQVLKIPGA